MKYSASSYPTLARSKAVAWMKGRRATGPSPVGLGTSAATATGRTATPPARSARRTAAAGRGRFDARRIAVPDGVLAGCRIDAGQAAGVRPGLYAGPAPKRNRGDV